MRNAKTHRAERSLGGGRMRSAPAGCPCGMAPFCRDSTLREAGVLHGSLGAPAFESCKQLVSGGFVEVRVWMAEVAVPIAPNPRASQAPEPWVLLEEFREEGLVVGAEPFLQDVKDFEDVFAKELDDEGNGPERALRKQRLDHALPHESIHVASEQAQQDLSLPFGEESDGGLAGLRQVDPGGNPDSLATKGDGADVVGTWRHRSFGQNPRDHLDIG